MILDDIALATEKRVAAAKEAKPTNKIIEEAQSFAARCPAPPDFAASLKYKGGSLPLAFICEVKKASPSKGIISEDFPYLRIAKEYEEAGASAISVLTEPDFFKGSNTYLEEIVREVKIPVLRKDFTIDEYQIYEARALGASAILLIVRLFEDRKEREKLKEFLKIAENLQLSALVEAHSADEVKIALDAGAEIIGVNNRDLTTFKVDINNCLRLRPLVPKDKIFVAESGIKDAASIKTLAEAGVDAILIGEALMKAQDRAAFLQGAAPKTANEGARAE